MYHLLKKEWVHFFCTASVASSNLATEAIMRSKYERGEHHDYQDGAPEARGKGSLGTIGAAQNKAGGRQWQRYKHTAIREACYFNRKANGVD